MISKEFYTQTNVVKKFFSGNVKHFLGKPPYTVLSYWLREVSAGETLYTIAKEVFGVDFEHHWVIIADINFLQEPDELLPGDLIKIPIIIIDELKYLRTDYGKASSNTTAL